MEKLFRMTAHIIGLVLVVMLLVTITTRSMAAFIATNANETKEKVTLKERERQLDCLAINIYKEAGHEPFEGKVGVAQVTMNRVASTEFPDDVCQVVYQKSKGTQVVCQFSWYCDRVHKNRRVDEKAYDESYAVAKKVLLEGFKLEILNDALFYHADYVDPNWRLDKVTKIGQHIFYKSRSKIDVAAL
jgi:spore germination cell wall hydrolase CwlJ-like protein